jgi:hypothetical protein
MLKKLLALSAGMLLTLGVYAATTSDLRDDHPDTYTVKRGDTLWDISARFLKKPWLWPELWQANPQIQNPHLIYPGDVLSLAYLNGNRAMLRNDSSGGPRVRAQPLEDAVKPIPLSELKNFLKNTRLVDEDAFRHAPHVVAIEENQLRGANGNLVYVKDLDAKPGAQFAILRSTTLYFSVPPREDGQARPVYARTTESFWDGERAMIWHGGLREMTLHGHSELVGHEMMVIGQGTVTRAGDPSSMLVTYSDVEVRAGDLILPIEDKPYDSQYFPHAPKAVPDDLRVINFTDAMNAVGPHQVVALSRGSQEGVENGQTYSVYHAGEKIDDNYKYDPGSSKAFFHPRKKKVQLPEEFIGHVMVFRTFDHISYGLVMDSVRPVHLDDMLHAPE